MTLETHSQVRLNQWLVLLAVKRLGIKSKQHLQVDKISEVVHDDTVNSKVLEIAQPTGRLRLGPLPKMESSA